MPKYKIFREYGYAGQPDEDIVECDSEKEAEELAWDWAIERVGAWAEPYEEGEDG